MYDVCVYKTDGACVCMMCVYDVCVYKTDGACVCSIRLMEHVCV